MLICINSVYDMLYLDPNLYLVDESSVTSNYILLGNSISLVK